MNKPITGIIAAQRTAEGEGFIVNRPFPTKFLNFYDPFLLLDEMGPTIYEKGEAKGAPDHPHRGFETVTYMIEGEGEHEDSAGNRGIIEAGGVQWMTAGKGVIHSEMPSRKIQEEGGKVHGFQLWVNLPSIAKMIPPKYQEKKSSEIPIYEGEGLWVKIIAGELFGVKAEIHTHTPILYWHVRLSKNKKIELPVPIDFNVFLYLIEGKGIFEANGQTLSGKQMIQFSNSKGESIYLENPSGENLDILVLGGKPLNEPVARYGPFVMNTQKEIEEAFSDYRNGNMGSIDRP
ncbi:MAG TPA: pirin family protein [Leptospiraceae bacterium]|nr:pirin family protein [Leptospiraceae bacterium]HMW05575.1 pirin family protein [Leptospiraceae bacterium]HMX34223.1 pirin family protein [Leptospiraceae bacterium]HMY31085.1 pirin family protein [Leptospiraceae bacterium]HMZ65285.1 pirin family protein [Leptospiraceae bacterium]